MAFKVRDQSRRGKGSSGEHVSAQKGRRLRSQPQPQSDTVETADTTGPTSPDRPSWKGKNILVVDDDIAITELLTLCLREEGYDAVQCVQSLRAYNAIREQRPDLILLDLMMPYLEGEDILRLMQLAPDTARIPVIVVTAKADAPHDEPLLRQLGVRHIVRKPFSLNALLHLVRQTLA